MTEAPEQIWASPGMPGYTNEPSVGIYDVQYIRKDVSDALVATAREDALREALDAAREYRYRRGEAVENAILALIEKTNPGNG